MLRSVWGLTSLDIYFAYNDINFLNAAEQIWENTISYQVSANDAQLGFSTKQNLPISATCANGSEWFLHRVLK